MHKTLILFEMLPAVGAHRLHPEDFDANHGATMNSPPKGCHHDYHGSSMDCHGLHSNCCWFRLILIARKDVQLGGLYHRHAMEIVRGRTVSLDRRLDLLSCAEIH